MNFYLEVFIHNTLLFSTKKCVKFIAYLNLLSFLGRLFARATQKGRKHKLYRSIIARNNTDAIQFINVTSERHQCMYSS